MAAERRTRILIVDDSVVMRSLLRSVVSADATLEVAGTAADGASALKVLDSSRPDLILLDVEMPIMDGLATLRELRRRGYKMPVIMCSSLTQRGATVTIEALASGASDYVAKPARQVDRETALRALGQDLSAKIHALTPASKGPAWAPSQYSAPTQLPSVSPGLPTGLGKGTVFAPAGPSAQRTQPITSRPSILAIGVSTGGPAALDTILPLLPGDFPLPVLIVQHMPDLFTRMFAERLNGRCKLRVCEAAEGDKVAAGTISIARGNWHLEVRAAARQSFSATLHLNQGPLENHCRPAVDVLFRSLAAIYGGGVLAVVLTGMGSDGTLGCRTIREHGGAVLAQDQASSTVWGMPGSVAQAGLAQKVLPLGEIIPEILRLVSRTHNEVRELRESAV